MKADALQPIQEAKPEVVAPVAKAPESPKPKVLTNHEELMQAAGIKESDWSAVEYIINHESSWRPTIRNNEGCIGLGQRCPASVLLSECPDLDAVCQLRHFTDYAVKRYGSWQQAYQVWLKKHWW